MRGAACAADGRPPRAAAPAPRLNRNFATAGMGSEPGGAAGNVSDSEAGRSEPAGGPVPAPAATAAAGEAPPDRDDLIPVRMLVEYAYCRRLGYLMHVDGEFEHNEYTVDGKFKHRNVDKPAGQRKMAEAAAGAAAGAGEEAAAKAGAVHSRSMTLSDPGLGIVGKLDVLEADGKTATPVEHKRGTVPDTPERTYLDHRVHVCAQALLLRANGFECTRGIVYYIGSKRRVEVDIDAGLEAQTRDLIAGFRRDAGSGAPPPPLVDSPKCPGCSLVGVCLPDEVNLLSGGGEGKVTRDQVRRMYPVRSDAIPLFVQEQWATVKKSGERLVVRRRGGQAEEFRLLDVSELTVLGNVQVTTQALRELCTREIPVCYMSYGGWFYGILAGIGGRNVNLRIRQHEMYGDPRGSMDIARRIVHGKARNCATMLRRNGPRGDGGVDAAVADLEGLAERALKEPRYEVLLGIEGMAARTYFGKFSSMIKDAGAAAGFRLDGRRRRPPPDPVNALLSFLYAMLAKDAAVTASRVGLDPHLGYLHRPRHAKPALALDLMEEFRPLVADSACLRAINGGEIGPSDFVRAGVGTSLTASGRAKAIAAYSRRLDEQVVHPLLGYAASYRRILATQARLLSRHLLGEVPSYPAFRTR